MVVDVGRTTHETWAAVMSETPYEYGRGCTGTTPESFRQMAACLYTDLVNMNTKWGIDDMTMPEWAIVDGNVEVRFHYASAKYKDQLQVVPRDE